MTLPTIRTFDRSLPHGITLACRASGTGGPRVLLLHGFPEAAFVWDATLQALAGEARCLAPNLRGYAGSSAPADPQAYRARHLLQDLTALADADGGAFDLVVAHDWGGAVAWNLAAQRPDLLRRLLIVNSPHPATFLRELRHNPAQQAASAYMNFLARPDAGALLEADDFARLWTMLEVSSAARPWLDDATRTAYRAAWRHGLAGPCAWYRASPLRPAVAGDGDAALHRLDLPDAAVTVRVPTRVLWGEADTALLPGLLQGLERWVPDLRIDRVPDASHWIVHEQPHRVLAAVRRALV